MDLFTLEDLARLSEAEAVRGRFDGINLRRLKWLVPLFAGVALAQLISALEAGDPLRLAAAGVNLVLCLVLSFALHRRFRKLFDALTARLGAHPRGVTLGFLFVEYALLALYSADGDSLAPWLIGFPYLAAFFRLAVAEALLLHGVFFFGPLLLMLFGVSLTGGGGAGGELLVAVGINDALALAASLVVSWRRRRQFLAQWRDARERSRDQLRMRQELDAAREIQLSMLPEAAPELEWLEVASLSLPATEVGGDYYDFFELGPDRLAVVSGDVAGHGVSSGLMLAGIRSGLTLLADDLGDPQGVMVRLHRLVRQTSRRRMLVTLAILLVDRQERRAALTSAGHPPLLRRGAGGEVEEVSLPALPLGTGLGEEFETREVPCAPGDLLLLYSDGLYELTGEGGEPYGLGRLRRLLAELPAEATAREVRDALLHDLWSFKGEAPQQDDITLVALRRRG